MQHVMIDIETLGTTPDAAVIAVGWCDFRRHAVWETGHSREIVIDLQSAMKYGSIDSDTLFWWLQQDATVREHNFSGTCSTEMALLRLVKDLTFVDKLTVWAKPPQFDIAALVDKFNKAKRPVPWAHRSVRDLRTLISLFPEVTLPKNNLTQHRAKDDAAYQAECACVLLNYRDSLSS